MSKIKVKLNISNEMIAQTRCFTNLMEGTYVDYDGNCSMFLHTDLEPKQIQKCNIINPNFKPRGILNKILKNKKDPNEYYITFVRNTNFSCKMGGNILVKLDVDNNPLTKYFFRAKYVLHIDKPKLFVKNVLDYTNKEMNFYANDILENYVFVIFKTVIQDKLANFTNKYGYSNVNQHLLELSDEIKKVINDKIENYGMTLLEIDATKNGIDDEVLAAENRYKINKGGF